jgi:hypothetical protein
VTVANRRISFRINFNEMSQARTFGHGSTNEPRICRYRHNRAIQTVWVHSCAPKSDGDTYLPNNFYTLFGGATAP